jgi:hypothetical protein
MPKFTRVHKQTERFSLVRIRVWMRYRAMLILTSVFLFAVCLVNYRPWRGYKAIQQVEFRAEAMRVTHSLLHEGDFANPFGVLRTGPTAHVAPGFPFLQFLILKSVGEGRSGWLALRSLPVIALGLQLALLPWVARGIGFTVWSGLLASLFGLLVKPDSEPLWEAQLAGLLCLMLLYSACKFQMHPGSALLGLTTGLLAGIAFHLQPVFTLPYFGWIGVQAQKKKITQIFLISVLPLILCVPWSVRNYRELGTPALRDNLGLELYVSFNDCAPYGFEESLKHLCHGKFHPNSSIQEAEAVRTLGESRYNRNRLSTAFAWISAHRASAGRLVLQRFWFFWFPSSEGLLGYGRQRARERFLHAFTLTSLLGLYLCWKHRMHCCEPLGLFLALFPLIYYVVEFDPRYRYPVLWITLLLAAHATLDITRWCGVQAVRLTSSVSALPASFTSKLRPRA